jgi:hypothetical protein
MCKCGIAAVDCDYHKPQPKPYFRGMPGYETVYLHGGSRDGWMTAVNPSADTVSIDLLGLGVDATEVYKRMPGVVIGSSNTAVFDFDCVIPAWATWLAGPPADPSSLPPSP